MQYEDAHPREDAEPLQAENETESGRPSMPAKQPKPRNTTKAETPGPSGLQPQNVKERETRTQKRVQPSNERSAPGPLTDRIAEAARTEADWPGFGLAQTSQNVRHRICIEHVINPMLNKHQLGLDFATTVRCLAACREADRIIGNIHTVIVWRDTILLQRSNGLDDALMYRWRQRDNYMALKTMATLREKGCWTCKKIKVYDTQPLCTTGTAERRRNMTAVMHRHLAELLKRFNATEEVKLPECPNFWLQPGVEDLRTLTTAKFSTPTLRGIPTTKWMPNQCWVMTNQLPILMRRADTLRAKTDNRTEYAQGATYSAYVHGENIPQRGEGILCRFPTTPSVIEKPTLQAFTWHFEAIHEQLLEEGIPQHFENVHITLRHAQPGAEWTSAAIRRIPRALQPYFFLKNLTITIQIADMDEELWVEEDGRPVAAYMLTMLRAAEKVQIETTEEQLEGRQKPYRTSIVIMNHLYSQTTTENVVIDTSAAIKRALTTCAHQNNFENFVSEAAHKPWLRHVLMPPIGITERSTIEADVHIGHIRWHSAPDKEPSGADNIDLNRREAIEAIENRY